MYGAVQYYTEADDMTFHMSIMYHVQYDHVVTKALSELKWDALTDTGYAGMFQN